MIKGKLAENLYELNFLVSSIIPYLTNSTQECYVTQDI